MEAQEKQALKEKLEGLTKRQKLQYFWDYHKFKVIIPAVVLLFLYVFISSYIEETRPLSLYIAIVNGTDILEAERSFEEDYPRDCGIDTKKLPVRIESTLVHPKQMDETAAADTVTVASMQKYQGILINGDMDVTIATEWVVDEYAKADAYVDLEELLPKELQEQIKDRFYYAADSTGKQTAVGIYPRWKALGEFREDGKAVLSVSAYSGRKEQAVTFIEWIVKKSAD